MENKRTTEKIKELCEGILDMSAESTGDYGMGGCCPFCRSGCGWDDTVRTMGHESDCIVNIAEEFLNNKEH